MTVLSAISTQFFHRLPALTRILSRGAVVVQMHLLPQLLSLRPDSTIPTSTLLELISSGCVLGPVNSSSIE